MTTAITDDELDVRRAIHGIFSFEKPTHIDNLQTGEAGGVRKTLEVSPSSVITSSGITEVGESIVGRTTLGMPVSPTASEWLPKAQDYLEQLREAQKMPSEPRPFPHLAWEALKAGLAKENYINHKLNEHIDQIQGMQQNINLLLELSTEISGLKEESAELPERAIKILDQLEARGIKLRKDGQTIEELKRQASSRESGLRSEMQIKFTTQVQRLMQQVESIIQILQNIIRSDAKVKEKANQLQK